MRKRRHHSGKQAEADAARVARRQCRHCGGPVPCPSPLGDAAVGQRHTLEVAPLEPRMQLNPEPLKVVSVKTCQVCRKRAPWCSCGEAAYE